MEEMEFPQRYKDKLALQMNCEIAALASEKDKQLSEIYKVVNQKRQNANNAVSKTYSNSLPSKKLYIGIGIFLGLVVIVKCGAWLIGNLIDAVSPGFFNTSVGSFVGVLLFLGGPVVGGFLGSKFYNREVNRREATAESVRAEAEIEEISADKRSSEISNVFEIKKKKIEQKYEAEYLKYKKSFQDKAVEQSVIFIGSEPAERVSKWLSEMFYRKIMQADRGTAVQYISASIEYSVFSTCVSCEGLIFDFERERIEKIPSALKQAALANAVSKMTELEIRSVLFDDPSGTPFSIQSEIVYGSAGDTVGKSEFYKVNGINLPHITVPSDTGAEVKGLMKYFAVNGEFQKKVNW